jgi:hypothetical protein
MGNPRCAIARQIKHRTIWENNWELFLSETIKLSWNVPCMVLYHVFYVDQQSELSDRTVCENELIWYTRACGSYHDCCCQQGSYWTKDS